MRTAALPLANDIVALGDKIGGMDVRKASTLRCTISLFSGPKCVKKVSYPSPLCSSVRFMRSLTSPAMSHLKMADG